jgi:hypothetical protein
MSATATRTAHINGAPSYEPKFLPKVNSIPVVNSLKRQLFTHVPQAESLSKQVGQQLSAVFTYTNDTPIRPMLIKLDTLAANGVAKLEKEVPIVASPTDQVLKTTKIDQLLEFVAHYYVMSINYVLGIFNTYKGFFEPVVKQFLSYGEEFVGVKSSPGESLSARFTKLKEAIVAKIETHVTPLITQAKETAASIYNKALLVAQPRLKSFNAEKDKAIDTLNPLVSELKTRFTKAESAAKDAWLENKRNISDPNAFVPFIKLTIFTGLVFGYNLVYPDTKKTSDKKDGVEEQTNGLVSGVELTDGIAKNRPNGFAS